MHEWRVAAVADCLAPVTLAEAKKVHARDYQRSGRYPVIDQGRALIAGKTDDDSALISENLPVIVFGDHTRALKFVDFPFVRGADGTQILKPKPGIDPRFFYYALRALDLPSRGYNRHFKALREREIAIPTDLDAQSAIARVLKLVDDAFALQDVELEGWGACKSAAMQTLITRGLRGEAQKQCEIGPLPGSWDLVAFDSAFRIAQGQVNPTVEPYASMLHVGPENVEPHTGRLTACRTATDLGLISGKYLFTEQDIIYSKIRPYLNKVALPGFAGLCSADMYPLRATEGFERKFLFHFLLSEGFLKQAIPHQLRTGIPKINREQLSATRIPRPPLEEQRDIAKILDAIDRKMDLHSRKGAVLGTLFKTLLHKLMTGEIYVADLDLSVLEGQPIEGEAA